MIFLRFEDIEVKKNITNVLRVIEDWIEKKQPTPIPSQEGNLIKEGLMGKKQPTPDPSGGGTP